MRHTALALWGAGLLLAGCQAQAKVQPPALSAGIPEIISRCVDGRDVAGQRATCTEALQAKVGSDDLQALARYGLAADWPLAVPPRGIPSPIVLCLYPFDEKDRLETCTLTIDSGAGSSELQALVHHARAIAFCRDGHPDKSVVDETQAIALVPNFPEAYAHRAECKRVLHDLDGASADLETALRLAPDVPGYYSAAGTMANLAGDHDAALRHFEEAIRRWPQFNEVVDLRAKTLFNLGRYNEAADAFVQTVKMFPEDELPVLWLHLARMNAGQPDDEEFAANRANVTPSEWTGPIFDYYQGRLDYRAALDASWSSGNSDAKCMALLFVGEHMLAKKEPLAFAPIEAAASICNPQTAPTSLMAAWAQMNRLSPVPGGKGWSRWSSLR